ncbi:(2Fe-2S) ferredoxin [Anoxybacillus vitaminiphilus]|uniref:(2Fe-2S) ferredoxin n=1 Tax=Paranoxybacillus vitaminiphilus TaxID=581036 RepID=A0A327YFA9_9BACL|nr:(2Fe-2S) ferredoxin domain-containing protein [Anoxybacillus vitaminiphilus]RAK19544.1 (2Fe-2S) ferredoxin [Anoxybacillus vitaminiphilus]
MATWNLSGTKHHVLICNGASCMRKGAEEVTQTIRAEIEALYLDDLVHTSRTRCNGRCQDACVVIVYPEGTWYKAITPELARQLVKMHLLKGIPLEEAISYKYEEQEGFFLANPDVPIGISKTAKKST